MLVNRLPHLVAEKGISLAELSRLTGLTYKTAVKLYYSDFTSLRIDTLDKLCEVLEVQPGDLLRYERGPVVQKPVSSVEVSPRHPRNKRARKSWRRGFTLSRRRERSGDDEGHHSQAR